MTWAVPVVVWALLAQSAGAPPVQQPNDLGGLRTLYSGAAYEEALALIARLAPELVTADHELYRALCFLALGRPTESEAALERVVRATPLYLLPEAEVTPRMVTMFRDVRKRVLPIVAREQYALGKSFYDDRRFSDAIQQFRMVTGLLADPDLSYPADAFADLRQLTDGFLRLAELEAAAAAKDVPATPAAPAGSASLPGGLTQGGVTVTKIVVYSREDTAVVPPVEVERFMPPWVPPSAIVRSSQEYRGEIEVIVDETGRVEQAQMTRPTVPAYDVTLLGAARRWRFQPARRAGEAVKYRMTFQILLAPRR